MALITPTRLLMVTTGSTVLGQSLLFAILPSLARVTGLLEIQMGLIIACSAVCYGLAIPVWGRFSEVAGRKRVIMIGLTGYALGNLGIALIFDVALGGWLAGAALMLTLILPRCLQSLVMAASPPAATAYMADVTDAATRVRGMGMIASANNIGTILGPGIGGALTVYGLTTPLYGVSVVVLLVLLLVWLKLPESPWSQAHRQPASSFRVGHALRLSLKSYVDRRLMDLLIIGALLFIVFAMTQQTLGFLFQDRFGYSPVVAAGQVGFTLMLSAVASLAGQILLVQRMGLRGEKLLLVMLPLMVAGFALIFWASSPQLIRAAIIFVGLGMGLGLPGVSGCASLRMGPSEQGVVAGMVNACPAFGFIIGPLLGTGLYQWHPAYCYGTVLALMLPLSMLVVRLNLRQR